MNYKITKDVPIVSERKKYRNAFTQALNSLEIGDAITGLTKKEAYKYRMNFYTKNFKERKFCFWRDPISKKYTVQRTA